MTGRIGGGLVGHGPSKFAYSGYRGSNLTDLRASNERLILSLVRIHGQLSKAQIAEITGLTKQTASVIVRSLEAEGLLLAGKPVKGQVGQPYVPMSINPGGALFLGLRLGTRQADLVLVDFVGELLEQRRLNYADGSFSEICDATLAAISEMRSRLSEESNARLKDLGIAISSELLDYLSSSGGDPAAHWTKINVLASSLSSVLSLRVYVDREAVAACSAELAYGLAGGASDFIYFFVGQSLDGGIVQHGRLTFAQRDGRPGIGRMLVPVGNGRTVLLRDSVSTSAIGLSPSVRAINPQLRQWIDATSAHITFAIHSSSALIAFKGVVIDGILPPWVLQEIVRSVKERLTNFDAVDISSLFVRDGTSDRQAAGLGAACLPLLDRFFLEAGAMGDLPQ